MTKEITIGDKRYFVEENQTFHIEKGYAGVVNLDENGKIIGWAYGIDIDPSDPKSVEEFQEHMRGAARLLPDGIAGSFILGIKRE